MRCACSLLQQGAPRADAAGAPYPVPDAVRRPPRVGHAGRQQAGRPPQGQVQDQDQETMEPGRILIDLCILKFKYMYTVKLQIQFWVTLGLEIGVSVAGPINQIKFKTTNVECGDAVDRSINIKYIIFYFNAVLTLR